MGREENTKIYLPSDAQRKIGEAFGKAFGEVLKLPVIDTGMLVAIQLNLEEENQYSRELIEKEKALIKRRNYSIKALQEILETKDFIKTPREKEAST